MHQLPLPNQKALPAADSGPSNNDVQQQNLAHMQRIWTLLQETPGFDPMKLLNAFSKVIGRPETQRLGRRVATGLVQKAMARWVREWVSIQSPASQSPASNPSSSV